MKVNFNRIALGAAALTVLMGTGYLSGQAALAQSKPADLMKQLQPDDAKLKKGQELFNANCISCHGQQGKGDGLAAAALNPKPRNFHSDQNWVNGRHFPEMFKTLDEGIKGSGMSSFSYLSVKDRVAILTYVRNFNKEIYPPITDQEVETLQKDYDIAAGLAASDQKKAAIPVELAMKKLVEEAAAKHQKVVKAAKTAMAASHPGAVLFRHSVYDAQRALTALDNANVNWHSSTADFAKVVTVNAEENGFKAVVATYTAEQWNLLHSYLKSLL